MYLSVYFHVPSRIRRMSVHQHVFAHIRSLTYTCTHLHVLRDERNPACVGLHCRLDMYVDMLARIKRQACMHVFKLGTLLHLRRAGHQYVALGDILAHDSQLHRIKNRSKPFSSRAANSRRVCKDE